jgi:hypothetical protein
MNSNNVLCASFGLFPSYVAGILNSVKEINFYALCKKRILRCASYLEKYIAGIYCTFELRTNNYFMLTSGKEEVVISFQSRFWVESTRPN